MTIDIGHTTISSVLEDTIGGAHFDREISSINIISKKEISRISWISSNLKELH